MADIVELASVRQSPVGASVVPDAFTIDVCVGDTESFFDLDDEGEQGVSAYWLLSLMVSVWLYQRNANFARLTVSLVPLVEGEDEAAAEGRFRIL